ncbi:MAG: TIGR02281 family clan AA aspartic protease [Hyphomicrobiales bacterium]|nr:TIGR02281 family clan AA aspartic protease [Hyphomicrobiales bacterium]MBV9974215.1 TIGR02281 family clan AA aspartic protease [Hyphomicrobiales bacterium]
MLIDVLKFVGRPLAIALVVFLLALKGFETLRKTPSSSTVASTRPAASMVPTSSSPAFGSGPLTLYGDRGGQFQADVVVEGATLRMLVDTGAYSVALTAEDAERAGIHPFPSDYVQPVNTANGVVMAAKAELREVTLGQIRVRDVASIVLPRGAGHISLLGMTFLKRLSSFQVLENRLVLTP